MPNYSYLIIGGGMTAAAAVGGIREVDHSGTIGLIGAEPHPPYDRPPLSKGLWKDKTIDTVWRKIDTTALTFHLGRRARELHARNKRVTDDQGTVYTYAKLLIATGCRPRRLPFGDDQIIYFRTVDDYQRLRELTRHGERFAVIGGGFIGSELAAALTMIGKKVTLIFPDALIGSRMYPADLAKFVTDFYREKGVAVLPGTKITGCESRQGQSILKIRDSSGGNEREISADAVIAGIGVEPNVELAEQAGLAVDNGIRTDASLRTSDPDIYAAGDVASFHNPALDQWLRVEHEDNANTMGRLAGIAMAGGAASYDHLPFFYSDLFEMGYEAVGATDSRLQTVADWKTPFKEGVVHYLQDSRVRGVLLWNIFGQIDAARKLIASPGPFKPTDLKGKL